MTVHPLAVKIRGCIRKFPDCVDNEINNNKHSLRSNTKGYGGRTYYPDSQNSDTTAPSSRELSVLAPGGQSGNFWIHPRKIVLKTACGPRTIVSVFLLYDLL
jgi:hypothetical protein